MLSAILKPSKKAVAIASQPIGAEGRRPSPGPRNPTHTIRASR